MKDAKAEPKEANPSTSQRIYDIVKANSTRQRAMLLSWVDELERLLGITPRTSQIRQFWRDSGEPELDKSGDS